MLKLSAMQVEVHESGDLWTAIQHENVTITDFKKK
jgi:hypothetical protein